MAKNEYEGGQIMKKYFSIAALFLSALLASVGFHVEAASFTFAQPGATSANQPSSASFATSSVDESTVRNTSAKKKEKKSKRAEGASQQDPIAIKNKSDERNQVHPDAAVKDTKPEEINLPGVMKIAGESTQAIDFTRTQVVTVNDTGSATVIVSMDSSNHIQTPWLNPILKSTNEIKPLPIDKDDNNIFFSIAEGVTGDVQIWLKDQTTRKVKGLILSPKKGINGQNIILRDSGVSKGNAPKSDSYVAQVQRHAEVVAFGNAPDGYSEIQPNIPPIVRNGLVITTSRLYSSADTDIYVYDVANPGPAKAMLTETEFDGPTVTAVSIFPKPLLNAKEHVKVIVEAKKGR